MARGSFADRVKRAMSSKVPPELTGGLWQKRPYSHIYLDMKNNFLDGELLESCNVKGHLFDKTISYHEGVASLNSSQAVCINFFKKFFEKAEWEGILLRALTGVGVEFGSEDIKEAAFEYVPDPDENTNFDFYIVLNNGCHISMEIKYSESEFGSPQYKKEDPYRYDRKWSEIYKEKVRTCPYLDTEKCTKEDFYANYQINRNICYAKRGDTVLFITPRANDDGGIRKGREYIDSLRNPRVMNVYWEDLVNSVLKLVINEKELMDYYTEFKKKYIDIFKET